MTYLDDGSRRRIRDDVAAWLAAPAMAASTAATRAAVAGAPSPRVAAAGRVAAAPAPSRAPIAAAPLAAAPVTSPADLVQAGDPFIPPALRAAPAERSPEGAAFEALVRRKIAERRADPWR